MYCLKTMNSTQSNGTEEQCSSIKLKYNDLDMYQAAYLRVKNLMVVLKYLQEFYPQLLVDIVSIVRVDMYGSFCNLQGLKEGNDSALICNGWRQ